MANQPTEVHREYMRNYRRAQQVAKPRLNDDSAAPVEESQDKPKPMSVADAVALEMSRMPAAYAFPALQQAARVLAECLDDPYERRHHPTAAGQLRMLLAEVRNAQVSDAAKSSLHGIRGELKQAS